MQKQTLYRRKEEIRKVIPLADGRQLELSRPLVMGILNVTPDSFSDGGLFAETDLAVRRAEEMIEQGADMIDIGGESTRPGSEPVTLDEELSRVIPALQRLRQKSDIPVSIDTCKSGVADVAIREGADIVNDISALRFDDKMAQLVARLKVPVVLMHMLGIPQNMQDDPQYADCVREVKDFFAERIAYAANEGIDRTKMILDPGIGFGKRLSDNLELLAGLDALAGFGLPLLVGASRKSFIGMLHPPAITAGRRLGGSIAAAIAAVLNGAAIVRVHDVAETVEALKVIQAIPGEE